MQYDVVHHRLHVWACITENHLIGHYLLPFRQTERNYLLFFQQVLPQLLEEEQISAPTQQTTWF